MARNTLKLDTTGFDSMLRKLDSLGGDVKRAVEDALEQSAETIEWDTKDAMAKGNLPRQGKYSTGKTMQSIITDSRVHWEGMRGWIPVGFDFSKAGAGGYLISGTPRMLPNAALRRMYKQKKYMRQIQDDMWEVVSDYVIDAMKRS